MAGLFPHDAIEKRKPPYERSPTGPRGHLAAPIPNLMPPDMGLMDEFIASGPGQHRGEGQPINYRKRK